MKACTLEAQNPRISDLKRFADTGKSTSTDHFVGVSKMVGGAARDLEQTIAGNVAEILEA